MTVPGSGNLFLCCSGRTKLGRLCPLAINLLPYCSQVLLLLSHSRLLFPHSPPVHRFHKPVRQIPGAPSNAHRFWASLILASRRMTWGQLTNSLVKGLALRTSALINRVGASC